MMESTQVLLFICGPLLLLLIALIVLSVRGSRRVVKFPTFTVRVERLGREVTYVYYRDADKQFEFILWPKTQLPPKLAVLTAPKNVPNEEILHIMPNLALGLARFGFRQYRIHKEGETDVLASGETKKTSS